MTWRAVCLSQKQAPQSSSMVPRETHTMRSNTDKYQQTATVSYWWTVDQYIILHMHAEICYEVVKVILSLEKLGITGSVRLSNGG